MVDGVLLGLVIDERLFLRTDSQSVRAYRDEGGKPYAFTKSNGEDIVTSYWSLPDRLYDAPEELVQWAKRSRSAALASPTARKKQSSRDRRTIKTAAARKRR